MNEDTALNATNKDILDELVLTVIESILDAYELGLNQGRLEAFDVSQYVQNEDLVDDPLEKLQDRVEAIEYHLGLKFTG